jgi:hypothetical protein
MVSAMPQKGANVPPLFYYMSPEQVKGELMDVRSNVFSWGAILYEMVTERKPFTGDDIQTVRQKILEETPEPPATINPRMNLAVSRVIMQALSKSPDERYAHGHELLADLERAKETSQAAAAKAAQAPSGLMSPTKAKPSADSPKFIVPAPPEQDDGYSPLATTKVKNVTPSPKSPAAPKASSAARNPFASPPVTQENAGPQVLNSAGQQVKSAPKKAAAAAAGIGSGAGSSFNSKATRIQPEEKMSAAIAEPEAEAPKFKTDPMMSGGSGSGKASSFSEIDELPPLKEVHTSAPEPPPAPIIEIADHPAPTFSLKPRVVREDKPRVVTRENARKAVNEIKHVPPKLMMYAITAAVLIILGVLGSIMYSIHRQTADEEPPAQPPATVQTQAVAPQQPQTAAPVESAPISDEAAPEPEVVVKTAPAAKPRRAAAAPKPVVVPGQLAIDSTPAGAQVQIDGRSDAAWATPYNFPGLTPGQHAITISKPGYASETRTVQVSAGSKSFVSVHLAALGATLNITSEPAGASIYIDGKDTGHVTPAQITGEKGSHTVLVRKQGYLDETTTATFFAGQSFQYSPTLRVLGVTDDIKTGGKLKRLFGGDSTAGMGKVAIKTQPKGAQITVNRRMVDKPTPVDFMLNPGNYMIDITLSGYKPIHRVINVEKGSKVELNENLEPE